MANGGCRQWLSDRRTDRCNRSRTPRRKRCGDSTHRPLVQHFGQHSQLEDITQPVRSQLSSMQQALADGIDLCVGTGLIILSKSVVSSGDHWPIFDSQSSKGSVDFRSQRRHRHQFDLPTHERLILIRCRTVRYKKPYSSGRFSAFGFFTANSP